MDTGFDPSRRLLSVADWEFRKASGHCVVTDTPFAEGDTVWSALFAHGSRLYRVDFSDSAWQARLDAEESGNDPEPVTIEVIMPDAEEPEQIHLEGEPIHYWMYVKPPSDQKPKRRYVDDDVLFDFFKKLEGSAEQQRRAFRYVLALHLIRRKRLSFADVVRQGEDEYLILNEPKNDAVSYKVLDPRLNEEQVLALREQMDNVLDMADDDEAAETAAEPNGPSSRTV